MTRVTLLIVIFGLLVTFGAMASGRAEGGGSRGVATPDVAKTPPPSSPIPIPYPNFPRLWH